jgi:hypothetical protein
LRIRRFQRERSDLSIVGRDIQLDATLYTVVGVLPAALRLPLEYTRRAVSQVWVPVAPHHHHGFRFVVGKRAKEHAVHYCENRRIRPDAESERHERDQREPGLLDERTHGKPDVAGECSHGDPRSKLDGRLIAEVDCTSGISLALMATAQLA